jgi:hypothetical protein
MSFGAKALAFYLDLRVPGGLPPDVVALNPYGSDDTRGYLTTFLSKYYNDSRPRTLVFGINPGRLGGGSTGISFTDPVALERDCGIANALPKKRELSSQFVYLFADRWGGAEILFRDFFFTAVCPFGFVRENKNFNYYDDQRFFESISDLIVDSIRAQMAFGASPDAAILLGTGKNQRAFEQVNRRHSFFQTVYTLEHPRFIMQYRRRSIEVYLEKYMQAFRNAAPSVRDGL